VNTGDLISETRRHLDSGSRPEINRLSGAAAAADTTVTLEFAMGGITQGSVLALELELVYVWSVAGQVATVQRGWLGSTAATHADDTVVWVNPRWSDFSIYRALMEEIRSYSSPVVGLYQMKTVDLTYNSARTGYDLTGVTDLIDVYELRWKGYTTGEWPRIARWSLTRDMATSEFASGTALLLYDGAGPGRTIRVRYKAPYGTLSATYATDASDTTSSAGLHTEAHDIPPLGAAARLVAPRDVKRSFTEAQPESRAAADVPPGTSSRAAGALLGLRNQRLREESARLHAKYPPLARTA
jgi:hypothetical protein